MPSASQDSRSQSASTRRTAGCGRQTTTFNPAGAQTGASALDRPETGDVDEGQLGEIEHHPHALGIDDAHRGRERLGPREVELASKSDDVVLCDCPMGRLKPNRRVEVLPESSH